MAAAERAKGATVLVCESSPSEAFPLAPSISALGFEVTRCPSPAEALCELAKASPDVIFAVLGDGNESTASMLQLLRRAAPTTPLVIVAGNATLELRTRCQPLRPYYFAVPPLAPAELRSIIQGALSASATRP